MVRPRGCRPPACAPPSSRVRPAAQLLPRALAMATRYGLGAEQALRSMTADAADMLGVADRVGRLQTGLDGDLVVLSGPPFDLRTQVLHVFVNGAEVPMNDDRTHPVPARGASPRTPHPPQDAADEVVALQGCQGLHRRRRRA